MVRAVVVGKTGEPPAIEEIELPDPGHGEVRVRMTAAGVCHSDLSLLTGKLPHRTPVVLGHEGVGTVIATGPGVHRVKHGDAVLLNWRPACGTCPACVRGDSFLCGYGDAVSARPYARRADGSELYPGLGVAAFAEETQVPQEALVPVAADLPATTAALLGCAILTGYGAVRNCAKVRPGESVVVYGVGGVGAAALQTARLHQAGEIIAVDLLPDKEDLARACGATRFMTLEQDEGPDVVERVRAATGGVGADHAVECVGSMRVARTAWSSTRRGGTLTVVGAAGRDDHISFSGLELFHSARTVVGCLHGNSVPDRDLPEMVGHIRKGTLDPGTLVTDRIRLDDVPRTLEALGSFRGGRSVVVF